MQWSHAVRSAAHLLLHPTGYRVADGLAGSRIFHKDGARQSGLRMSRDMFLEKRFPGNV